MKLTFAQILKAGVVLVFGQALVSADPKMQPQPQSAVAPPVAHAASAPAGEFSFNPMEFYSVGKLWPKAIASADINGDGRADLVINFSYSAPFIYYQAADGSYEPPVQLAETGGDTLVLADVDGDKRVDIIVQWDNALSVFHNLPEGFEKLAYPATERYSSLFAVDVDGDKDKDLLAISEQNGMDVFKNDGIGGFPSSTHVATQSFGDSDLSVEDVNGDGLLDLVVSSWRDVYVFQGIQHNDFSMTTYTNVFPDASMSLQNAVGDFNRDGRKDIALGDGWVSDIRFLIQNPDRSFSEGPSLSATSPVYALGAIDLDANGLKDLVVLHQAGELGYFLQFDTGFAQEKTGQAWLGSPARFTDLAVGDFDADGYGDVGILGGVHSGGIWLFKGNRRYCSQFRPLACVDMRSR